MRQRQSIAISTAHVRRFPWADLVFGVGGNVLGVAEAVRLPDKEIRKIEVGRMGVFKLV